MMEEHLTMVPINVLNDPHRLGIGWLVYIDQKTYAITIEQGSLKR